MTVFGHKIYSLEKGGFVDVDGYRVALVTALESCATSAERQGLLSAEAVEITRHVTDGIRELVRTDWRIRNLVLNQGLVPLASWAEALDSLAHQPLPVLRKQIDEMRRELEQGRIEGFPGTMTLYGKPTFATFEGLYEVVFELAEERHPAT